MKKGEKETENEKKDEQEKEKIALTQIYFNAWHLFYCLFCCL